MLRVLIGSTALVAASTLAFLQPSHAEEMAQAQISPEEKADLQLAIGRGQKLFQYDQAAWHATDALLEDIADLESSGIGGWVITEQASGLMVTFWKVDGPSFSAVYSAIYDGTEIVSRNVHVPDNANLTDEQVELIQAWRDTRSSKMESCSRQPLNSVVFRSGEDDETVLVYYLTPQETFEAIPLGGHNRFEVRGGKIIDYRRFSKSCIALPIEHDGTRTAALGITHILDRIPTEIHVFSMLASGLPIYVSTAENGITWVIESSSGEVRVRMLDASPE